MSVVVSDTSPLRALAHLGLLAVPAALFGEVLVPPAVAQELRDARPPGPPVEAQNVPGLRVVQPTGAARFTAAPYGLHGGEAEAIALALEAQADLILIDERRGERIARGSGLPTLGVLGLPIQAKRAGLVNAVLPLVDELKDGLNFFISDALREQIRLRSGE